MWNKRSAAQLASNDVSVQRDAAFWMLVLNGGRLENNDRIVLEGFANEQYHYASTAFEGTGQARGRNGFGSSETFVVVKLSGSSGSEIRHDDRIALRSSQGTYLTAMPADYFDGQIQNYGTFVGTWQGFTLRHVSQHDRARPSW